MNDKDKEAFRKCRDMSEFYASCVADQKTALVPEDVCEGFVAGWQAACEYKNREYSDIVEARIQTSFNNVKLQAENAKLRECVEFYADLDEEAIGYDIRGVTYARQVLKELEDK